MLQMMKVWTGENDQIPTLNNKIIDIYNFVIFVWNIPLSYLQLVRLIHSHLEEKRDRQKDRHLLCCEVLQMPHYTSPNDEDKWESKNLRALRTSYKIIAGKVLKQLIYLQWEITVEVQMEEI